MFLNRKNEEKNLNCILSGKRVSLIIKNNKGQYVLAKIKQDENDKIVFPWFDFVEEQLPDNDSTNSWIQKGLISSMGIEAIDIMRVENFFQTDYSFNHYIYLVRRFKGNLKKGTYTGFVFKKNDELNDLDFDIWGQQVLTKITECTYCRKICAKKSEIEFFLNDYMQHNVGEKVFNILNSSVEKTNELYQILINSYFSHLRALMVETPSLKKNRTIQNLLGLYERTDLINEINSLLDLSVYKSYTFKEIIKVFVDKNVAHYDFPDDTATEVCNFCNQFFSANGGIPLEVFISNIESYIVSILFEVLYYAGQLGEMISDTDWKLSCVMDCNRKAIINYLDNCFNKSER